MHADSGSAVAAQVPGVPALKLPLLATVVSHRPGAAGAAEAGAAVHPGPHSLHQQEAQRAGGRRRAAAGCTHPGRARGGAHRPGAWRLALWAAGFLKDRGTPIMSCLSHVRNISVFSVAI